jgi:hypothetical protein
MENKVENGESFKSKVLRKFYIETKVQLTEVINNLNAPMDILAWRTRTILEIYVTIKYLQNGAITYEEWLGQRYKTDKALVIASTDFLNENLNNMIAKFNESKELIVKDLNFNAEETGKVFNGGESIFNDAQAMFGNAKEKGIKAVLSEAQNENVVINEQYNSMKVMCKYIGGEIKKEYERFYPIYCAYTHPSSWKLNNEHREYYDIIYKYSILLRLNMYVQNTMSVILELI